MPAIQALWVSGASVVAFCFHTTRSKETGHDKSGYYPL